MLVYVIINLERIGSPWTCWCVYLCLWFCVTSTLNKVVCVTFTLLMLVCLTFTLNMVDCLPFTLNIPCLCNSHLEHVGVRNSNLEHVGLCSNHQEHVGLCRHSPRTYSFTLNMLVCVFMLKFQIQERSDYNFIKCTITIYEMQAENSHYYRRLDYFYSMNFIQNMHWGGGGHG